MKELITKIRNAMIVLSYGVIVIPFAILWLASMVFVGILDVIHDDNVIAVVYNFGVKTLSKITKIFGVEDEDF